MSMLTSILERLSADARAATEPLLDRWSSAKETAQQRTKDLMTEVGDALDEVIAADPLEAQSFEEAISAARARFRAIADEIPTTIAGLTGDWDAMAAAAGAGGDRDSLAQLWSAVVDDGEGLRRDVETLAAMTVVGAKGCWARELRRAAELEWGGQPGPATALYLASGVHALSQQAAWIEWRDAQLATRDFHALTDPTAADRERYRAAARAYWTAYYEAYARLHPGFTTTPEDAVAARLAELDEELSDRT